MIGDGPTRNQAERTANRLGLDDRVHFISFAEEVQDWLAQADLLLHPSEMESFGLVPLEAMSCGVPVVAYRVGGLPEVVEDGGSGSLLEVGDVEGAVQEQSRHPPQPAAVGGLLPPRPGHRPEALQHRAGGSPLRALLPGDPLVMTSGDKTVAFFTLGCKLNQFETYDLERQFVGRGYRVVPFSEGASVSVINTCTVTGKTDYRCRQTIRKARRRSPEGTVIAVGCYAQTQPGALAGMPEVDFVLGNSEKGDIFSHLDDFAGDRVHVAAAESVAAPFGEITGFGSHTRAFVKIQDGCDSRCSYCVVPLARGPNRSRGEEEVLHQTAVLAEKGYREIVLTGVHLGTWGRDLSPARTLASLLRRLVELPGLERLRLSSVEPTEFTGKLMEVLSLRRRYAPISTSPSRADPRRSSAPWDAPTDPGPTPGSSRNSPGASPTSAWEPT